CAEPGLHESPEMLQIAAAPGCLVLDGARPHRVDRAQRVRDNTPAGRRGAPIPVGTEGERNAVRHRTIMAAGNKPRRTVRPCKVHRVPLRWNGPSHLGATRKLSGTHGRNSVGLETCSWPSIS